MILVLIIALMVVFGAATFVLFYSSMYYQRRAKILNKIPLLDVVELENNGQARIKGRVVPFEETLRSPLSNAKCVYYRFIIEEEKKKSEVASNFARRRGADDDDADIEWETVVDEVKVVPFGVEDESGVAEVAVKELDADVHAADRNVTGYLKSCSRDQENFLLERYPKKKLLFNKKMRYTEITIEKGDKVAVQGEVQIRKGRDPRFVTADEFPVHVSDKTDNSVLQDALSKAKSMQIFGFVSSACVLGATVWLVIYLATPSNKGAGKAVADSSDAPPTTSPRKPQEPALKKENNTNEPFPILKNPPINAVDAKMELGKKSIPAAEIPANAKPTKIMGSGSDPEFKEAAPPGAILVGFEFGLDKFFSSDVIRAVRPIYLFKAEEMVGVARGSPPKGVVKVLAKPGYAVGALTVKAGAGLDGLSVTFMKIAAGKLDAFDFYESDWVGGQGGGGPERIGGDGSAAIGILGRTNNKKELTGIGLLFAQGDVPIFNPPRNDPPRNDPPRKSEPKNDFDTLVAEVQQKNTANDVFGMKDTLARIEKNIPKDHPRRAELFKVLAEGSRSANVFIKGDCTGAAARYAGKEDVPELLAMLKEKRNVFAEGDIFKKLQELKDPASAELMAEYLTDLGKRGNAMNVLRAIGSAAEKEVLQYIADTYDVFTRGAAIELLGDIGTQKSVQPLRDLAAQDRQHSTNATKSVQKILKRK